MWLASELLDVLCKAGTERLVPFQHINALESVAHLRTYVAPGTPTQVIGICRKSARVSQIRSIIISNSHSQQNPIMAATICLWLFICLLVVLMTSSGVGGREKRQGWHGIRLVIGCLHLCTDSYIYTCTPLMITCVDY